MDILDQILTADHRPQRKWSHYQQAFFDKLSEGSSSIQLEARAGSGKSTTLAEVPRILSGPIIFLAFMRSNMEDLKAKVYGAEVRTFNSLGSNIIYQNSRGKTPKLEISKLRKLLPQIASADVIRDFGDEIQTCVRLAKNSALGIDSPAEMWDFFDLIEKYDLDVPTEMSEQIALFSKNLFDLSNSTIDIIDFDDQLYFPCLFRHRFPSYNVICVDEDQDLSSIQHVMLEHLQLAGSSPARIIGVGDRRQAIYAFRGALTNSVDLLKSRFRMEESPLSISYRCSKAVVNEAKKYCPDIEAAENAIEGAVLHSEATEDPRFWSPHHMVLCRTNAPLFSAILRYVRKGEPCQVKSNFLDKLGGFVRRFKAETLTDLQSALETWYSKEKGWAVKQKQFNKLHLIEDKYETLSLLISQSKSVSALLNLLKELANSKQGTSFSTIHKAKGLEAKRVYILRPDLMPAPWVKKENVEELQQELNMLYVGITRAKEELTFGETP